jgi:hypothetical protein
VILGGKDPTDLEDVRVSKWVANDGVALKG